MAARGLLQDVAGGQGATMDMVIAHEPQGQLSRDLDIQWLLNSSYLVFFMQCGFALLEAGSVRSKNTKNILLKNVMDACVGALVWWGWGHSLAFGENGRFPNEFIGGTNFFMSNSNDVSPNEAAKQSGFNNANIFYADWVFQWAFAATSATIVSGALAERCQFRAYLIYTFVITGFVYPVVAHWVWSREGWLSTTRDMDRDGDLDIILDRSLGLIDFAGGGVVHVTGGGAALAASWIMGPRYGRFETDGTPRPLVGHSVALSSLGVFILWFGWYGFNPGSTKAFYGNMYVASKCAVATTLAAAAGGVAVQLMHVQRGKKPALSPALNGILVGLVSITSSCAVVEPYGAVAIGVIGGILYDLSSKLLLRLRLDDPLDASPVHFVGGLWSLISVGFLATPANLENAFGRKTDVGVLYGGDGHQLGVQILGAVVISTWTFLINIPLFSYLNSSGLLRVSQEEEITGLDVSRHGGVGMGYAGITVGPPPNNTAAAR
eukprot:evm.model.scf_363.6 EVM.evm.TU.scf_363.6   scf_363:47738-55026(+)